MKCNKTQSKWCVNKHGASKIIDTFETYHPARLDTVSTSRHRSHLQPPLSHASDIASIDSKSPWGTRASSDANSRPNIRLMFNRIASSRINKIRVVECNLAHCRIWTIIGKRFLFLSSTRAINPLGGLLEP
jgi:hypothetical protein